MKFIEEVTFKQESVINEKTGEIEQKTFKHVKESKEYKGGWNMMYAEGYDLVVVYTTGVNESKFLIYVKQEFSKHKTEITLSPTALAKASGWSRQEITKYIKKLVGLDFIMQIANKSYRMNPFMIVPTFGDAELLQKEWKDIRKERKFIRRGTDLYDLFKASDYTKFDLWYKDLKKGSVLHQTGVVRTNDKPEWEL